MVRILRENIEDAQTTREFEIETSSTAKESDRKENHKGKNCRPKEDQRKSCENLLCENVVRAAPQSDQSKQILQERMGEKRSRDGEYRWRRMAAV